MTNVFIFGAGYSARAYARIVAARGVAVAGTTRRPENFARLEAIGIEPLLFDGQDLPKPVEARLSPVTHLVASIAPGGTGDPVLAALGGRLASLAPELEWIGYLSTVGVYGDHGGGWVDEDTPCRPVSRRSQWRIEAENAWAALGRDLGMPTAILRLGGIYGPGRNPFVKLAEGTARRMVKPGQVFNRIHVEDIAGAIDFLALRREAGIFNVTDCEPAPPQDVIARAAELMGVPPPPETPFDAAELSPMARSFYGENKRVSNARLRQAGYRFRYPDYRSSLAEMWRRGDWHGE